MEKVLNKFYDFIDKIGKPNFIFLVFIIFIILVTGLYQTFSLFTSTDGTSIIDGILTYKFILNNDNTENSITIAASSSKSIMMTISNPEKLKLKYGIYYSSSDDLTNVNLGYLSSNTHKGTDLIEAKENYTVKLKVKNNSNNDVTITFGISYGLESGGDLLLDTGKHWLEEINDDEKLTLLSEVGIGTYVQYTGNNGCTGNSCLGENANYINDSNKGYCANSNYKFSSSGWRVAYIKDGTAYLISAGSPECLCTSINGEMSSSCSNYESSPTIPQHIANLNNNALKYCNSDYAYGGTCDSNSAWNINKDDLQKITNTTIEDGYQKAIYDDNALIDVGSFYWFSNNSNLSYYGYFWTPVNRYIYDDNTNSSYGNRPVLRLKATVAITGGDGSSKNPYTLTSTGSVTPTPDPEPSITYPFNLSEAKSGTYVKYTGNNGCSGKACEGQNANYVSPSDMGYCSNSSYKFDSSGWRVAYVQNGSAYLVSGGAPECLCTNSDGTSGTSCSSYEKTNNLPNHIANLNAAALKYCNPTYAYGGYCNVNTTWNINNDDFIKITGSSLNSGITGESSDYPLISNNGYYWFASVYSSYAQHAYVWYADSSKVYHAFSMEADGVRPVIKLKSTIVVTSGKGTYDNPYIISTGT